MAQLTDDRKNRIVQAAIRAAARSGNADPWQHVEAMLALLGVDDPADRADLETLLQQEIQADEE